MAKNTIKLKKYTDIINEYDAGGVITPGMLVLIESDGDVVAHDTEDGYCAKLFALEDELRGKTIDDNFASGDPVQVWFATPGEEVYAILDNGEDISEGDLLSSAGNGKVQAVGSGGVPIAQALEDVDMSGSSGVDPSGRIEIRIL